MMNKCEQFSFLTSFPLLSFGDYLRNLVKQEAYFSLNGMKLAVLYNHTPTNS